MSFDLLLNLVKTEITWLLIKLIPGVAEVVKIKVEVKDEGVKDELLEGRFLFHVRLPLIYSTKKVSP